MASVSKQKTVKFEQPRSLADTSKYYYKKHHVESLAIPVANFDVTIGYQTVNTEKCTPEELNNEE